MKMAVIGSGPIAILTASHFDKMGADVTLFQRSPLGGNVRFLMDRHPDFTVNYQNKEMRIGDFFNEVIVPEGTSLEEFKLTKQGDVLRVHKRFLHPKEVIPKRTRMHDLFRVIYSLNPQENILKQLDENPELFNKLGAEVVNSLHKPVESFLDFDIVIEASGMGGTPAPMGAGRSLALNENNLQGSSVLFYEKEIFTKLSVEDKKTIILVGEGASLKLALLRFKDWLFAKVGRELHWVTYTTADTPCGVSWLDQEVNAFLKEVGDKFTESKSVFEKKMHEWRDLEDYVKAKVPKPVEPTPLIVLHEGYEVTAVDRLLDREGVFATIESPDFRDFSKLPNDMKTLAADALCVARGVNDKGLNDGFEMNEPGYYKIATTDYNQALQDIKSIEESILNYFKKA